MCNFNISLNIYYFINYFKIFQVVITYIFNTFIADIYRKFIAFKKKSHLRQISSSGQQLNGERFL